MIQNIWYCHPYAGGPDFGNSSRAFHLASCWGGMQRNVTVFSSSWHHLIREDQDYSGVKVFSGVRYAFIKTRRYRGNGMARLLNMFDYCAGLLRRADEFAQTFGAPDMLIVSSPHPYAFLVGYALALKWSARLIFEVRDIWPLSLTELAGVPRWHPLVLFSAWVERFAYRRAHAVVSLLPGAKNHMVERGLAPEKFIYIPNGVINNRLDCLSSMNGEPEVLRRVRAMRQARKFILVYPGAMGPPNNMGPLIEAAALLEKEGNAAVQIVLMGQGGDVENLRDRVKNLGLRNVHFFPQAERAVALRLMQMASLGYVSVRRMPIYRHGISFNKLFEYMQQRLPVLFAADVPGNPVEISGCGVVTAPDDPREIADSILKLSAASQENLRSMGLAGENYVRKFHDYSFLAKKYLTIFNTEENV